MKKLVCLWCVVCVVVCAVVCVCVCVWCVCVCVSRNTLRDGTSGTSLVGHRLLLHALIRAALEVGSTFTIDFER